MLRNLIIHVPRDFQVKFNKVMQELYHKFSIDECYRMTQEECDEWMMTSDQDCSGGAY